MVNLRVFVCIQDVLLLSLCLCLFRLIPHKDKGEKETDDMI